MILSCGVWLAAHLSDPYRHKLKSDFPIPGHFTCEKSLINSLCDDLIFFCDESCRSKDNFAMLRALQNDSMLARLRDIVSDIAPELRPRDAPHFPSLHADKNSISFRRKWCLFTRELRYCCWSCCCHQEIPELMAHFLRKILFDFHFSTQLWSFQWMPFRASECWSVAPSHSEF